MDVSLHCAMCSRSIDPASPTAIIDPPDYYCGAGCETVAYAYGSWPEYWATKS
jgi:hypothetical protein